jgi:hypothetical protein
MAKHGFRFMEVPNMLEAASNITLLSSDDWPNKLGFVAFCEKTGGCVIVHEHDAWQGYAGAPQDLIERIPFAMDRYCSRAAHELVDEA